MDSTEVDRAALEPLYERLLEERIALLYANGPTTILGNLLASALLVFLLRDSAPGSGLGIWLLAVLLVGVIRWFSFQHYRRAPESAKAPRRWGRIYVLLIGLNSCLWGVASVVFFSPEPEIVAVFIILLAGAVSASVAAHAVYLPACVTHALPTVLPFAARLFWEGGSWFFGVGTLSVLFMVLSMFFARNAHRNLVDLVRLRFEKEALAAALSRQRDIAEHANLAKTRFLAAASHDLRQPVQALAFFSDALAHEVTAPQTLGLLDKIRATGRSLQDLLDALLDVSRIEAAAVQVKKRNFCVAELLERLRRDFLQQAQTQQLRLRVAACDAWVYSDPVQLERILRNIVSNAIKYTPRGGVLIGCRRADGEISIEVHDTGVGIAPELQDAVFREFYQLDNPERDREKGLGLGLAIADGLARLLGHSLGLRSTPGRGSVFSIKVPRGEREAANVLPQATPVDDLQGRAVLLIDDDALVREAAAAILERFGCVVVVAESGEEALDLMQASGFTPEAMLVDYRLRGASTGVEVIRQVQAHCARVVPAALLTGDTAPDRLREVQASGFALCHKPLSGAKLRALLSSLLLPVSGEPTPGSAPLRA